MRFAKTSGLKVNVNKNKVMVSGGGKEEGSICCFFRWNANGLCVRV